MSKFSQFLKTLGGNLQEDYTKSGLMGMDLPTAGNYTKYAMPVDSNVRMSPDTGSITSSRLLESMQLMLANGYRAAVAEAAEGEDSQLKKLAKQIKV
tara:strand:- start:261 stop:551 length:291 start_codon:yes stop_codon:yes gene_type:complete